MVTSVNFGKIEFRAIDVFFKVMAVQHIYFNINTLTFLVYHQPYWRVSKMLADFDTNPSHMEEEYFSNTGKTH